ncbi:hypothetical protein T4D_2463 [Trichinella pseudospiralis]|uniref:Uncharacterized protein n=1 Tax=Trichinella pseudospiralis TaxID=6337 RepID=A0A0V1F6D1_TRIPS|nr:hypothetical protein T4D_2463 [Trichinella pseudospiralis]
MYAELEGLAESLSDDDHVEKVDIFIDEMNVHIDVEEGADPSMKAVQWSRRPEESILRYKLQDTKPVTGGAFCYPPNLPMFVLAKRTSITMVVCSRSEFRGAGKAQRRRNMYAELEGLAESLSDDDHVEKVDIFIDEMNVHIDVEEGADPSMKAVQWSRRPEESILRYKLQ